MSIRYSGGTLANDLYIGVTTKSQVITDIGASLTAAGWTETVLLPFTDFVTTNTISNTETVTIDGQVYTFKTVINNATPNEVLIGLDQASAIYNLKQAINTGTGGGTLYSSATVINTNLSAGLINATSLTINQKSAVGGPYAVSDTCANASWTLSTSRGAGSKFLCVTTPAGLSTYLYVANAGDANTRIRVMNTNVDGTRMGYGENVTTGQALFGAASQDIRIIANRYQCFIFIEGVVTSTNCFFGCGVPWIPDFLFGQVITAATNASPIVVQSVAHGYTTGDIVTVVGVVGNTAANVTGNTVTVLTADTFELDGTTGNAAYTSGGLSGKIGIGGTLSEAIWSVGTANSSPMFAGFFTADSNTFWSALNGSDNRHTGGGGTGTLKGASVIASAYQGEELLWYNGAYFMTEPLLQWGTATATTGYLIGQAWGMIFARTSTIPLADAGAIDGHNWYCITDNTVTSAQITGVCLVEVP